MKWQDIPNMTAEQAAFVRKLRLGLDGEPQHTWRAVAEACSDEWGGDWDSNQLAGMDLCRYAAAHFGEDHNEEPWN